MSDQFDELIKGKIESKQYAYSAKAWHSYAHHAGFFKMVVIKWVAIAVSSLAVLSAGGYFLYQHIQNQANTESINAITPNVPQKAETVLADSTSLKAVDANARECISVEPTPSIPTKSQNHLDIESTSQTVEKDSIVQPTVVKKTILRPRPSRRILEINTDTIPTNY